MFEETFFNVYKKKIGNGGMDFFYIYIYIYTFIRNTSTQTISVEQITINHIMLIAKMCISIYINVSRTGFLPSSMIFENQLRL